MRLSQPERRLGELIAEPLAIHGLGSPADRRAQAANLMARVGLSKDQLDRYPHEFPAASASASASASPAPWR